MKAAERFARTLNFQETEGVCTFDIVNHPDIFKRFAGAEGDLLERNARMCRTVGIDSIRTIWNPDASWAQLALEDWAKNMGITLSDWAVEDAGGASWIAKRPFHDVETLRRHLPRMPTRAEIEQWYVPYLKHVREVFGEDLVFIGELPGPITWTYCYMGLELFALGIELEPELMAQLMDMFAEWSRILCELWVRHPTGPACMICEDMAYKGGTLFSPKWMRANIWPRHRYVLEPAKKAGFKCLLHSDGDLNAILDDLVNVVELDGLNPIETIAGMDPVAIRQKYPRLVMLGCVDTSHLLPFSSATEIEAAVTDLIQKVGPRGLCIGSTNEVHVAVPVENALAMYRTAHAFREA